MTIDGVDAALDDLLNRVASEAERYMRDYINRTADNPTGRLAGSIYNESRGKRTRAIGSRLEYASYADQGRGPVSVRNKISLHWVYPRPSGQDFFAKSVGRAEGLHFIDKTKEHIENMNITF